MIYTLDYKLFEDKIIIKYLVEKYFKEGDTIIIPSTVIDVFNYKANEGDNLAIESKRNFDFLVKKCSEKNISVKVVKTDSSDLLDSILEVAKLFSATILVESNYLLLEKAKVEGIPYKRIIKKIPNFEKWFDKNTITIFLVENSPVYAKKRDVDGVYLDKVTSKPLSSEIVRSIRDYFLFKAKTDENWILDKESNSMYVIRYKDYRITIIEPPKSDKLEISIVRTIKTTTLADYNLPDNVIRRIDQKAGGILICGSPGSGKSTFAKALLMYYKSKGKIVRIIENPASERMIEDINYISKNMFKNIEEIKDFLLLARPDYVLFDEVRDEEDFKLYIDLRLAGINLIGVTHGTSGLEAIMRFMNRIEVGMLPAVIDTIFFLDKGGKITEILELTMVVKVPTGMAQKDELARPVIEVRNLITGELLYEIYKYGQETTIVDLSKMRNRIQNQQSTKKESKLNINKNMFEKIDENKEKNIEIKWYNIVELFKRDDELEDTEEVLDEVYKNFVLSDEIHRKIIRKIDEITKYLKRVYDVDGFIGGSLGKGCLNVFQEKITIQYYLLFDLTEANIYDKTKSILNEVFPDVSFQEFKPRDKYSIYIAILKGKDFELEDNLANKTFELRVIPVKNVSYSDLEKNFSFITDAEKNYARNKFTIDKLNENPSLKKDLALLRLFTASCMFDESNAYVEGVPPFALELMLFYFGSFKEMLDFFYNNDKYPILIDVRKKETLPKIVEKLTKNNLPIPKLIVIDPLTGLVNTIMLKDHAFSRFVLWVKLFKLKPSKYFFYPYERTIEDVKKIAEIRGCEIYTGETKIAKDFSPVIKSVKVRLTYLKEKLKEMNKEVYDCGVILERKVINNKKEEIVYSYMMTNSKNTKKEYLSRKPWEKEFIEEFKNFVEKYKEDLVLGPFVEEDGSIYFDVKAKGGKDEVVKNLFSEIMFNKDIKAEELEKKLKQKNG